MKVAIIGSRDITDFHLDGLLPPETAQIISGGAPIRRNATIVDMADAVIAIWDGQSRGTAFVIEECRRTGKPCRIIRI